VREGDLLVSTRANFTPDRGILLSAYSDKDVKTHGA